MSTKTPEIIKILFIEDEKRWQQILLSALEPELNLQLVNVVVNGQQALDYMSTHTIDLIIMDYELVDRSLWGVELTKKILAQFPKMKIIFWSIHMKYMDVNRAKKAGARGYIQKTASDEALVEAIRKILKDETEWISLVDRLTDELISEFDHLTPKEVEIMEQLSEGKNYGQIALSFLQAEYKEKVQRHGSEKVLVEYGDLNNFIYEVPPEDRGNRLAKHPRIHGRTRVVSAEVANIKDKLGIDNLGKLIKLAVDEFSKLENVRSFTEEEFEIIGKYLEGNSMEQTAIKLVMNENQVKNVIRRFNPDLSNPEG